MFWVAGLADAWRTLGARAVCLSSCAVIVSDGSHEFQLCVTTCLWFRESGAQIGKDFI